MSPAKTLQLPPPSNWPDFEELCWELWKEIWQDPGTSRNGRPGQAQQGVDISGRPKNGKKWAGVQCKGKDNYADKFLTVKELREEVQKALTFKPKLSEFIVATSGPKDATVEKEARLITAKHRKQKFFSVSVFGWQDIVDRLAEHPDVLARNFPEVYGTVAETAAKVDETLVLTRKVADDTSEIRRAFCSSTEGPSSVFPQPQTVYQDAIGPEHQAELDHARDLLRNGNAIQAREYLEKLKERIWSRCEVSVKYRLLTNLGFAYIRTKEESKGAQYFVQAFQYSSKDDKATTNCALGHLLLGDTTKAEEIAKQALEINPTSVDAYHVLLHVWASRPVDEVISLVPTPLRENPEIVYAIGFLAEKQGQKDVALQWLNKAVELAPDRPEIRAVLGASLIHSVLSDPAFLPDHLPEESRRVLTAAVGHLNKAWDDVKDKDTRRLCPEWLNNRGLAKNLLGNAGEAAKDIDAAIEIAPTAAFLKKSAAIIAYQSGDLAKALRLFQDIENSPETPDAPLHLAQIYQSLGESDKAVAVLDRLLREASDPDIRKAASHDMVTVLLERGDCDRARSVNADMRRETPRDLHCLIDSVRIERRADNADKAIEYAGEAAKHVKATTRHFDILLLANELYALHQYADAARLYQMIADSKSSNPVSKQLLNSYHLAERQKDCLVLCLSIIAGSGPDKYVCQMASTIYEQIGDLDNAEKICSQFLRNSPEDFEFRLRLALIRMRRGDNAGVDAFLDSCASVPHLEPHQGTLLATLFSARGRPRKSVALLYELRRTNFNDPNLHRAYIGSVLNLEKAIDGSLNCDAVGVDSAVCLRGENGQNRWYVIEERRDAEIRRGELQPDHHLAKRLWGKNAGDKVIVAENPVETEEVTISEIVSKYVFALRESMEQYESLFPGRNDLMKVKFDTENPTESVEKILQLTRSRKNHIEQLEGMYAKGPMPLGFFSRMSGINPLEALDYVTSRPELGVRCSIGNEEEREKVSSVLKQLPCRLVADVTTLVISKKLGILPTLVAVFGRLFVSQSTVDMLRSLVQTRQFLQSDGFLSLGYQDGQPTKLEVTAEDVERDAKHLEELESLIRDYCDIVPCAAALNITKAQREEYVTMLGKSFTDTMLIASSERALIYSDDLAFRLIAETKMDIGGVWTQALLMNLLKADKVTLADYQKAVIDLACLNYRHTSVSGDILVEAARRSGWVPAVPFTKVVKLLGGQYCEESSAVRVGGDFCFLLWKERVLSSQRDYLMLSLFGAITDGRPPNSMLKQLTTRVHNLFHLAPTVQAEFTNLVESWKKAHLV